MIAKVVFDSPLPSLDRAFDYEIPESIQSQICVGIRVRVHFGRQKKLLEGFVIEIVSSSDFTGQLTQISEIVSDVPVFPSTSYRFLRALADRQACTLGDLLKLAVPKRSVKVEKLFVEGIPAYSTFKQRQASSVKAMLCRPLSDSWAQSMMDFAETQAAAGFSSILIVPDFRDVQVLVSLFKQNQIEYLDSTGAKKGSERYSSYLTSLTSGNHVVIGTRNAVFTPLQNLGGIAVYDDADASLTEPTAPYHQTREAAMVRASLEKCDLLLLANYRSVDVQRLVEIGFAEDVTVDFAPPRVVFTEEGSGLPALAWQQIKQTLDSANPNVLIQFPAKGIARSTYCKACGIRANCMTCNGPIWLDAKAQPKCRWCNALNLNWHCKNCSGNTLKQGSGGTARTAVEISRSFPGVKVIESNGDSKKMYLDSTRQIVVATPGAEPRIPGGYGCVVILDASATSNRDSLRAAELAYRSFANAIALAAETSISVLVGVSQSVGLAFSAWKLIQLAQIELHSRAELRLPPHVRIASLQGEVTALAEVAAQVKDAGFEVFGPISLRGESGNLDSRFVIKYSYSQGQELAQTIRSAIAEVTAGLPSFGRGGRPMRQIRTRMDDPEVI